MKNLIGIAAAALLVAVAALAYDTNAPVARSLTGTTVPTLTTYVSTNNYVLTLADQFVLVHGAGLTVVVPALAAGKEVVVMNQDNTTNTLSVSAGSINGNGTYGLTNQYRYVRLRSTGGAWFVIGGN